MESAPQTSSRHFTPRQLAAALGIDPDDMHWKSALIGKLFALFPDLGKCCQQERLEAIAIGKEEVLDSFAAIFTITEPRRLDGAMRGTDRLIHAFKNNVAEPARPIVRLNAAEQMNFGRAKTAAAFNLNAPRQTERRPDSFSANAPRGRERMIAAFGGESPKHGAPHVETFAANEMSFAEFKTTLLALIRAIVKRRDVERLSAQDRQTVRIKWASTLPMPPQLVR